MKIVSIFILTILFFGGCKNKSTSGLDTSLIKNPATASGNKGDKLPVISFTDTKHDFGKIIEGETVSFAFKFTNTGRSDLIIANVIASCGCTVPSFPKKPIRPGESEFIDVAFDSKGRPGTFTKSVTVYANTSPNQVELYISGNVVRN